MAEKTERRYDVDWLRVLAILMVFLYHCSRFFTPPAWHISNSEESIPLMMFVGYLDPWLMPIFFLLSGVGSWYALEGRGAGAYIKDRVKRLFIPFWGVGMLILIPPQYFWQEVWYGSFQGSFVEFYPEFFKLFKIGTGPFFGPHGHLWFLHSLLIISLLSLPLLLHFKSDAGRVLISKIAGFLDRRGGALMIMLPLILVKEIFGISYNSNFDWPEQFLYMFFFLVGFIYPADKRFRMGFERDRFTGLTISIISFMVIAAGMLTSESFRNMAQARAMTPTYIGILIPLTALQCWGFIVFALGTASRRLNFTNKWLSYGNEAVLPFYIFHQAIILWVGWYIIPMDLPALLKYIIIAPVAFSGIIFLYELAVKRLNPVRFLFGMKQI